MSERKRECLLEEARRQTDALHRLGVWKRAALSLAVIGVILMYTGTGAQINLLREVFGLVLVVFAGGMAFLIHIGQKNGKKNVKNILKAAEG